MRVATWFWISLIVCAAFALYQVKYKVRDIRNEANKMEAEVLKEQESLHVLQAEWAHLSSPDRLQRLSARYLLLVPSSGAQLTTNATIKARLETVAMPQKLPVQQVGYGR